MFLEERLWNAQGDETKQHQLSMPFEDSLSDATPAFFLDGLECSLIM